MFHDSGASYPVPTKVRVIINYYDEHGDKTQTCIPETYSTLALVSYSRVAREQICFKGRTKLVLDGGELCGGREIYEEILEWLEIAWSIDDPSKPFPPLRPPGPRNFKDTPVLCLNYYRALCAFELTPRAEQNWIVDAMWRSSDSDKMPDPNWVYEVWAELSCHDLSYVQRTIMAAVRRWKPKALSAEQLEAIRQIAKQTPDLYEQIDRAMDAVHWTGYLDWLASEDRGADPWEHATERSTDSMDCEYDDELVELLDALAEEQEDDTERRPSLPPRPASSSTSKMLQATVDRGEGSEEH